MYHWLNQHLGRAKDISEFVKHGAQEARIEIELQGQRGSRNPIIVRRIIREGNASSFTLDGTIHTKPYLFSST